MLQKIRKDNNGFTLIEIVVTTVVLAIFSIPLLMYFTDAVRQSVRTKQQQNAVVAAQNVLEELKVSDYSLDTPDKLTATAGSVQPGWSLETAPDAAGKYEVSKLYTVNKTTYRVKAAITPSKEVQNAAGNTVKYQDVSIPSMNSTKDVIATESGGFDADASFYFYSLYAQYCEKNGVTKDSSITESVMKTHLQRDIHVKLEKDTAKADHIKVTVSYDYTYALNGGSYPAGINVSSKFSKDIEKASLPKTKIENIFIFYYPEQDGDSFTMEGTADAQAALSANQLGLYLVAQNSVPSSKAAEVTPGSGTIVRSASYQMKLPTSCGGNIDSCIGKVFTNLSGTGPDEINGGVFAAKLQKIGSEYTLISLEDMNRVADIEVTVFRGDSLAASNQLANVQGTKIQHEK